MVTAFRKEEEVFLKGKIKWCKHIRPDTQWSKWSVVMYVDGLELDKVREWQSQGIKNSVKKDADGWYITLSRKTTLLYKGKEIGLEPPRVVDKMGVPIDRNIGNGSDGVAGCILWTSKNYPGKNLRWVTLRVDNMVEFNAETDYIDKGEGLKTTLAEAPEELWV